MAEAYIVAAKRTAGGRKNGRLKGWHPADLAAAVLDDVVKSAGIDPARVDDVIMGCVTQIAGQAFNVARNAVLASQILPESVPGVTLDRQCGSSQQALHFAAQAIMSGSMNVVIASGVESMTRAPMNSAYTLAVEKGLEGPMSPGILKNRPGFEFNQFLGAEMIGEKYGISKDDSDRFAFESHRKAIAATKEGRFSNEIIPLPFDDADGKNIHNIDEGIRFDASFEGIQGVKLLQENGIMTAASASQICDGASAVVVASAQAVKEQGLTPLARVHHMDVMGHDPVIMLEAPIPATERALQRAGMKIDDIGLFEVNEAFSTVPLGWLKATGADPARLNIYGGAIALGHPLGASGTKLATTLIHALHGRNQRFGLQTMCEGGGMANVTIFERL